MQADENLLARAAPEEGTDAEDGEEICFMSALWLAMAVTSTSTSGLTLSLHEPSSSVRCAHNKTIHFVRHAEGWHNVDELEAEAAELWKTHPQGELRSTYGIAWMLLKQVSGDKYLDLF